MRSKLEIVDAYRSDLKREREDLASRVAVLDAALAELRPDAQDARDFWQSQRDAIASRLSMLEAAAEAFEAAYQKEPKPAEDPPPVPEETKR